MPKIPGLTLTGIENLLKKLPLIGGYRGHASSNAAIQDNAKTMGTHFTTSPNTAAQSSVWEPTSGNLTPFARPSTSPVVADIKNPMTFPTSPTDWRDPNSVLGPVQMGADMGMELPFPKGILSEMERLALVPGRFEKDLIPTLKEGGYDAIKYPGSVGDFRLPMGEPNSYMAFDPKQVMPRFSPEGQEAIKSRGVTEPPKGLLWDDSTRVWNTLPDKMKATIEWVQQDPGALGSLPMAERKEVMKLLTRLRGE